MRLLSEKKGNPLQWNTEYQRVFETLNTELSRTPALGLSNLDSLSLYTFTRGQE